MSVIVRKAGRRDLQAIQELWQTLRELEAKIDPCFRTSRDGPQLVRQHRQMILADPRSAFLVAEEHGRILAYLHAEIESNDPVLEPARFGVVVDIIVREDRRREGIGGRLMDHCREWFASQAVGEFRAAVPVQHPVAERFFAAQQAVPRQVLYRAEVRVESSEGTRHS